MILGRLPRIFGILCLAIACGWSPSAFSGLQDTEPEAPLCPPKSDGWFSADLTYRRSGDFYSSSGDLLPSIDPAFPDGIEERYHDIGFTLEGAYGLTDRLMLWLAFPILYRNETATLHASDLGLGDMRAGTRYRFFTSESGAVEAALELAGKFPSGDTDLETSDSASGKNFNLPLGSGNLDITSGLLLKHHLGPFAWEASASYTFRFNALMEYLHTSPVLQSSSDGSTVSALPVGNLTFDWGDEIDVRFRTAWKVFKKVTLSNDLHYFYRFDSEVENFDISSDGTNLFFDRASIPVRSTYLISTRPAAMFRVKPRVILVTGVDIPLYGKSYPTIPIVESLVGVQYQVEVRYAF